jgi:arsenate reductase
MKIYHNPRCSKSRQTLQLIEDKDEKVEIIEYLKTPLTKEELKDILKKLGKKAEDIIRKGEPIFQEKFQGKEFSEEEWLNILTDNPILIERPIVVRGDKAIIGRPPEKVLELL